MSRVAVLAACLFVACGGRSTRDDVDTTGSGAANGATQAVGGSSTSGPHVGGSQAHGGKPSLGGTIAVGTAGEAVSTAGEATGTAGEAPGTAGESTGAAGEPPIVSGAGAGGQPDASGGANCSGAVCRALCLRVARNFALVRAQATRCDNANANACTQFVGPSSINCDCPVPYATDRGAEARALQETYARYTCGNPNAECQCPAWETASCVEGRCAYAAP